MILNFTKFFVKFESKAKTLAKQKINYINKNANGKFNSRPD